MCSRLVDTACIGFSHLRDAGLHVLRQRYLPTVLENLRVRWHMTVVVVAGLRAGLAVP